MDRVEEGAHRLVVPRTTACYSEHAARSSPVLIFLLRIQMELGYGRTNKCRSHPPKYGSRAGASLHRSREENQNKYMQPTTRPFLRQALTIGHPSRNCFVHALVRVRCHCRTYTLHGRTRKLPKLWPVCTTIPTCRMYRRVTIVSKYFPHP